MKIYVPNNIGETDAAAKVTDLCVGAHQDDVELMAYCAIEACAVTQGRSFGAVTMTDGAGSPRGGDYAATGNEEMAAIRASEQCRAADVGRYGILYMLGYTSAQIKDVSFAAPVAALAEIFAATRPERVYLHNISDKHPTHVACALAAVAALRTLPAEMKPERVYGMEVWRSLDWLSDADKTVFPCRGGLSDALLSAYPSQLADGKAYDKAVSGRRAANATFLDYSATDTCAQCAYGMDITELITQDITPYDFMKRYTDAFAAAVLGGIASAQRGI